MLWVKQARLMQQIRQVCVFAMNVSFFVLVWWVIVGVIMQVMVGVSIMRMTEVV